MTWTRKVGVERERSGPVLDIFEGAAGETN